MQCRVRASGFLAAADALFAWPGRLEADARSLARLALASLPCLSPGAAPLACLHAVLALPPPSAVRECPSVWPRHARWESRAASTTPQPLSPLLRLPPPLLARVLALLPPRALLRCCACCVTLAQMGASGQLPSHAPLRFATYNIKNNSINRFTGQPAGIGCTVWPLRKRAVAAALAQLRPSVCAFQEDDAPMVRDLFADQLLHDLPYKMYPQPGDSDTPRELLGEAEHCDTVGGAAATRFERAAWEQGSIVWDDSVLMCVDAGAFEWRDGRAYEEAATLPPLAEQAKQHMIPCTWTLLRWRAAQDAFGDTDTSSGCFLVVCTHFEAGHGWNTDVPAKARSATLLSLALGRLRGRFGHAMPAVLMGDFNAQKVQGFYRRLLGESGFADDRQAPGCALIDAFDAWQHDCLRHSDGEDTVEAPPNGTIGAPWAPRVRTGGCNGTTWHNWGGRRRAMSTSCAMAKQCQHRMDLEHSSAQGHQRHIDHVLLCADNSMRGRVRVQKAWVDVGAACRTPRCLKYPEGGKCDGCDGRGTWGSDHFPVLAHLSLFFRPT